MFLLGMLVTSVMGWHFHGFHRCSDYVYINQMLGCKQKLVVNKGALGPLEKAIEEHIAQYESLGMLSDAAVYFRDLFAGPVFGINEDAPYSPASLLKLPLAFVFFSLEEEQALLERKLLYQIPAGSERSSDEFEAAGDLLLGKEYTLKDMLRNMLVHSDNLAYQLLVEYMQEHVEAGPAKMLQTLRALGIIEPNGASDEIVTVHEYSSLFRQLYNASFLSAEHSNLLLGWLAESNFDAGLAAGVPQGVVVADKYGIRDGAVQKQLHDCGVVYYPKNPYLLCIMTKGTNFEHMADAIREISAQVYAEFDKRVQYQDE